LDLIEQAFELQPALLNDPKPLYYFQPVRRVRLNEETYFEVETGRNLDSPLTDWTRTIHEAGSKLGRENLELVMSLYIQWDGQKARSLRIIFGDMLD